MLLGRSVGDRAAVGNAVADLSRCGPHLSRDLTVFQDAAASRQSLLSSLAQIPGASALPASLTSSLAQAWQASILADQDFEGWARDEISRGCVSHDTADPNYQAATGPDHRATRYKKAFASAWSPIAAQYGLPAYQWSEL